MKDTICELIKGLNSKKVEVIPNWEDENYIKPLKKEDNWFVQKNALTDKFVVLYSGNMSIHHDLDCILGAADILKDEDIYFLFVGEGIKKKSLQIKTKQMGLKNVIFLPFQPYDALPYSLTSGDTIIVSQVKGSEGLCVSCKLYAALASGRPITALIGKNSEISKVVSECNCGLTVDSYDSEDLANAIYHLATDKNLSEEMGLNARKCFLEYYTKNHAIDKYYKMIEKFDLSI